MATDVLVDWDLHPRVPVVDDLFPYMTVAWRNYYRSSPFYAMSDREAPPAGLPSEDPDAFARTFLDGEGVDVGVLVPIQAGAVNGLIDHVRAAAFVRSFNDYLADRWLPADHRFRLAATVSPLDPVQAAREVRRMARSYRVAAVFLPLINRPLGSGHYDPIFAAAQHVGLPILLHPTPAEGVAAGAPVFAAGVPTGSEMRAALLPEIGLTALCSLAYDGAFERFPELRIILSDYGFEWVPTALWRLDTEWAAADRRLLRASHRPADVIREHVLFVGAAALGGREPEELWRLLRAAGLEASVRFGSDAPYRTAGYRPKLRAAGAPPVLS